MKSRHLLIASAVAVTAKWAKQNPNTLKAFISLPAFPLGVDAVRFQGGAAAAVPDPDRGAGADVRAVV